MKRKIKYSNEPMGKEKVVADFLPSPEKLVIKKQNTKLTNSVSAKNDLQQKGK